MEAYGRLDHQEILDCLTEDVEWTIPGFVHRQGKSDFEAEIENDQNDGPPKIEITRMTEENDVVVAEGTVAQKLKTGVVVNLLFCDVFVMHEAKIKHLISYLVVLK